MQLKVKIHEAIYLMPFSSVTTGLKEENLFCFYTFPFSVHKRSVRTESSRNSSRLLRIPRIQQILNLFHLSIKSTSFKERHEHACFSTSWLVDSQLLFVHRALSKHNPGRSNALAFSIIKGDNLSNSNLI